MHYTAALTYLYLYIKYTLTITESINLIIYYFNFDVFKNINYVGTRAFRIHYNTIIILLRDILYNSQPKSKLVPPILTFLFLISFGQSVIKHTMVTFW